MIVITFYVSHWAITISRLVIGEKLSSKEGIVTLMIIISSVVGRRRKNNIIAWVVEDNINYIIVWKLAWIDHIRCLGHTEGSTRRTKHQTILVEFHI